MQTLCKPPRRVYDAKAIEACHHDLEDGIDMHDAAHIATVAAIGAASSALGGPGVGAAVAVGVWVTEADEKITHKLEEVGQAIVDGAEAAWDALTEDSSGPPATAGSKPPSGSGYPGANDPYADDHKNAQSGSY